MQNSKIEWCKNQKSGFKLIEPNINLAIEYFNNAEETLRVLIQTKKSGSNMWIATQKYYYEYFCAYSILMRIGIKTEIHSCAIEILKFLEEENLIQSNFSANLERDKGLRIENQYYLKNIPVEIELDELREIILTSKDIIDNLKEEEIIIIKNKLDSL